MIHGARSIEPRLRGRPLWSFPFWVICGTLTLSSCSVVQGRNKIPPEWESASVWICKMNFWDRAKYDGESAVVESSAQTGGQEYMIDIKKGIVHYAIGGDVYSEYNDNIMFAQARSGGVYGSEDDNFSFITVEYEQIKQYYINFKTGFLSLHNSGIPISTTVFGKCVPKR